MGGVDHIVSLKQKWPNSYYLNKKLGQCIISITKFGFPVGGVDHILSPNMDASERD